MSPLTHSAASRRVDFSTPGRPPLSFLQNLRPSLPLSSCVLPFLLPVPLLKGGGLVGGRKWAFGMELAGVMEEVRNPGHPSCRRKVRTQSLPSPLGPTPVALCQAQPGPVLLHFIPLIPYPRWGDRGGGTCGQHGGAWLREEDGDYTPTQ